MKKYIPMNPYDAPAVEHWLIETAGDEWKLDHIEGARAHFISGDGKPWRFRVVPAYPTPPTVPAGWEEVSTFGRVPLTVYETCDPEAPDFSVNQTDGDAFYRHWFWRCLLSFLFIPLIIGVYDFLNCNRNWFAFSYLIALFVIELLLLLAARGRWRSGIQPKRFRPVIRWRDRTMFGMLAVLILLAALFITQTDNPIFSGDLKDYKAQLPCLTLEELSDRPITKLPAVPDTVHIIHFIDIPTRINIKEGFGDGQQIEYKRYWTVSQAETALQKEKNRLIDWGYTVTELETNLFDRAVLLDKGILLIQKGTVFLNVFVGLEVDLGEYLDDYARALEAFENQKAVFRVE